MSLSKILELANQSGGTLYLMALLMLIALTVIIERSHYLSKMQSGGDALIALLHANTPTHAEPMQLALRQHAKLPHISLFQAALIEPPDAERDSCAGHLEEAVMREVPTLDRSLWLLDTVITLAPLLGLFGTIIGMFGAFSVLGDVQNGASQVTGGIAEALIATASGLAIAMIGLIFFNWLSTKVRVIVHQMETIKVMLLNRRFGPPQQQDGRSSLRAA
ncbi:MotA/TolQ/ExbB proton channel family protein [Paucibacter sp. DJ1R-11]|uniref:MotA/TolQ/ExbB proton channel family protein n=1 Tax=Paucibacter sp. DJ1R-11 TaxID=2893556 RepID=UPI0021E3BBD6|nr:MotA/TolQ/ExbB proton channel family protein [Paucibacter sp. DJ1R-11]MCV2365897.1 MotA/TolQ/ExbB proton channel family protein [Paucibacter sp. DJ1R-11]